MKKYLSSVLGVLIIGLLFTAFQKVPTVYATTSADIKTACIKEYETRLQSSLDSLGGSYSSAGQADYDKLYQQILLVCETKSQINTSSNNTQGACSSHSGVNCTVGASSTGYVICNDGWTDSTVLFSNVLSCTSTTLSTPNTFIPIVPTYAQIDFSSAYLANFYDLASKLTALEKKYSTAYLELLKKTPTDYQEILDEAKILNPVPSPSVIETVESTAKSMSNMCDKTNTEYNDSLNKTKQTLQSAYNDLLTRGVQDTANIYQSTYDYFTQISGLMQKQTELCKLQINDKKIIYVTYLLSKQVKDFCPIGTKFGKDNLCWCDTGYTWNDSTKSCMKLIQQTITTLETPIFTDITALTPYKDSITTLKQQNIISGYSDGSFKPDNTINRAELLKIIIGAKYPVIDNLFSRSCFKDIPSDQWYTKYVCFAKGKNIIEGYPDGTFKPDQSVNYVEALKMLLETYGLVPQKTTPWYQGYVDLATSKSIFMQSIGLDNSLKRGEMAELMVRTINSQTANNS